MIHRLLAITTTTIALVLSAASCNGGKSQSSSTTSTEHTTDMEENAPKSTSPFVADSALLHIRRQVDFGPRVPNTSAHRACATYLADYLRSQGLTVTEQAADLTAWDGTTLRAINIIGVHNPNATTRILLCAHWDTRPLADHDEDHALRSKPIDGADDGASGVGVLMEIARLLRTLPMQSIGVDIVLFDAEDYGVPAHVTYEGDTSTTWALGSQYWAQHPHTTDYRADFGILLDMVGSKDATFYREQYSQEYAGQYVSKVWETAARLGYQSYFRNEMGGGVTDDHVFVMQYRRIPCVDIINYNPHTANGFGHYWHTHKDNIDNISTSTLRAVGQTVWQVLTDYDAAHTK